MHAFILGLNIEVINPRNLGNSCWNKHLQCRRLCLIEMIILRNEKVSFKKIVYIHGL